MHLQQYSQIIVKCIAHFNNIPRTEDICPRKIRLPGQAEVPGMEVTWKIAIALMTHDICLHQNTASSSHSVCSPFPGVRLINTRTRCSAFPNISLGDAPRKVGPFFRTLDNFPGCLPQSVSPVCTPRILPGSSGSPGRTFTSAEDNSFYVYHHHHRRCQVARGQRQSHHLKFIDFVANAVERGLEVRGAWPRRGGDAGAWG